MYNVIKNLHVFKFETRKTLIHIFKELSKLKDYNDRSELLNTIVTKSNFSVVVTNLIEMSKRDKEILGCAAKVLKFFAKSKETFQVFLVLNMFNTIFALSADHNLQIASEYQEIMETLVLSSQVKIKKKTSEFIYSIYNYVGHLNTQIFLWIKNSDNLLFTRNILNFLYRMMSDPEYKKFKIYFINHKVRSTS